MISDDLGVISDVFTGKNIMEEIESHEFIFHRNHSLSLGISGIQTHSVELRSTLVPMIDYQALQLLLDFRNIFLKI